MNLQHFLARHTPMREQMEFFDTDQFPLDDEEIADTAINAMLLVMNNSQRKIANLHGMKETRIEDYAPLAASGIRFPWRDRIALSYCIDRLNDELPRIAAIGLTRKDKNVFAQAVGCSTVDFNTLPKHAKFALNGSDVVYRSTYIRGYQGLSRGMVAGRSSNDIETITDGGYAGVMPDGHVVGVDDYGRMSRWHGCLLAYAISMHNDRRYFWEVTAKETFWDGFPAKAMFSIDEEFIKSLFYARSVPITATGRLKPILHWVSSHKRRIKEGIDIDVKKHMRGINSFVMHGVNFDITEPRKPSPVKVI